MTTNTPPYRISYSQGPDGKVSIAVDISGPLPDPLDGMSPEERRAITRRSLSFSEYVTLWSVRHLPAAARHVVWVEILSRRRQAFVRNQAEQKAPAPAPQLWEGWHKPSGTGPVIIHGPPEDMEPEPGM